MLHAQSFVLRGGARQQARGKSDTHDLKFDGFAIQLDGSDLEVHPNGADVALRVRVILEDQGQ